MLPPGPAQRLPPLPGAYILIFRPEIALAPGPGKFAGLRIPPGIVAYCGSARGPGGIAARVGRHLRPDKRRHWHIDHLSAATPAIGVLAAPGATECALAGYLSRRPGACFPVPGFGSSDCRQCPAHLVALPGERDPRAIPDACPADAVFLLF